MLTPSVMTELCSELVYMWQYYIEETFGAPHQGFSSDSQQKDKAIQRQNIEDFKKAEDKAYFIASNRHTFLYGLACGFMRDLLNCQQQYAESTFQDAGNAEESEYHHNFMLFDLEDPINRSDDWKRMQNNRRPHGPLNKEKKQNQSRREHRHIIRKANSRKNFSDFCL